METVTLVLLAVVAVLLVVVVGAGIAMWLRIRGALRSLGGAREVIEARGPVGAPVPPMGPVYSTGPVAPLERVGLPLVPGNSGDVELPGTRCEGCRFWDWEGGQHLMAGNPAFAQATTFIPPWQMGRPRKVKENPEYLAKERELQAAIEAENHDLQQRLHEELLKMSPGEILPDTEQAPEGMLALEWGHLGACREHGELRFRTDTCERWQAKPDPHGRTVGDRAGQLTEING